MKYILKKMVLEKTPDISLNKEKFELLKNAKEVLSEAFSIEEKYELLLLNFLELQKEPLIIGSDYMVRERFDYSDFFDIQLSLNRRIVNLLTSTKLYIDHLLGHVKAFSEVDKNIRETVSNYLSEEYDLNFEYRFMEALRNHVQHRGLAVHSTPIGGEWKENGHIDQLEYKINVLALKKYLAENDKFKKNVLNEMPEKIELLHASKVYISGINSVHLKVRSYIKGFVGNSREQISQAIKEYSNICDGNVIGLSAISYSDEFDRKNFTEEISLLLDWDDVRVKLEKRNGKISNLGKRYVSGSTNI